MNPHYLTFLEERFRKSTRIKISELTKLRLIDKGLPIFLKGPIGLYPSARLETLTYNNEEYCILGNFSWRGGPGDSLLAVKNTKLESKAYKLWVKDNVILNEPMFVNSDIENFCLFIEAYVTFSEKYWNEIYVKMGDVKKEVIVQDFNNLVSLFREEDKEGLNSIFWREGLFELKYEGYGEYLGMCEVS